MDLEALVLTGVSPGDVFSLVSGWTLSGVVWGRQLLEQRTVDGCMSASLFLSILFFSTMFPR